MTPVYRTVSDRDRAYAFVLKFFSMERTPSQKGLILTRNGDIQAAVIYDWYSGPNIFMHLAARPGRRWLNRDFLKWAFDYPFRQLGCQRVSLWVEQSNTDCIRFVEHLGFTREAALEGVGVTGGDVIIFKMRREDCKYA